MAYEKIQIPEDIYFCLEDSLKIFYQNKGAERFEKYSREGYLNIDINMTWDKKKGLTGLIIGENAGLQLKVDESGSPKEYLFFGKVEEKENIILSHIIGRYFDLLDSVG